jgi:hypothetical protein
VSGVAESALVWKLKSANTNAGTRVYPRIAPQESNKYPYIIIDRPPGQENPQTAQGPASVIRTPLTVYCVGETYQQSRDLAAQIKPAINPSGFTSSVKWNNIWIDHCTVSSTYDASGSPIFGDEVGFPIEAVECVLFYLE